MEDAEDPLAPRPSDYAFMKSKQFKTYERYQFSTANNKDHADEVKEDKNEFFYLLRKLKPTNNQDCSHKIKNEEVGPYLCLPPKIEPTSSLIIDSVFSLDDVNITVCNRSSLLDDNNPPNIGSTDAGESLGDCKSDERDCNTPQERQVNNHKETVRFVKHFSCHSCGYETKRKNDLKRHIDSKHNQKELIKCDLCDYSTLQSNAMTTHRDTVHLGVKKFSCLLCGSEGHDECCLNAPIISNHSQNKIFLCDLCDFFAASKNLLARHTNRDHKGIKPFLCRFCGYQTRDKVELKEHKASKHDQNDRGMLLFSGAVKMSYDTSL